MDFKQIQELIKIVSKSDLSVLKIEQDNFKITLKKGGAPVTVSQQPAQRAAMVEAEQPALTEESAAAESAATKSAKKEKTAGDDKYISIKSPMVGTFYRSSSPDKEPFVKVGDIIRKGDHICIIEAMKLFNEIESEHEGKVVKVLVEDAKPVEYEQPLFLIEPA
jgi:acetyl-CoA carboxylase biotin carboxyl carrier protein